MSKYNNLINETDIVIRYFDNTTKFIVDTNYGNSLSIFSDTTVNQNENVYIHVDWGDGISEFYILGTGAINHHYNNQGRYTVVIDHNPKYGLKFTSQLMITELLRLGVMPNYTNTFLQCENLQTLYGNCLQLDPLTKELINTFQNCYSLSTIPEKLLYDFQYLENINGLFKGCGLIDIPKTLFKYNLNLKSLIETFRGTRIKTLSRDIFKNRKTIKTLRFCFADSSLETIESKAFDDLLNLEDGSYLFYNAYLLGPSIPEELFKNCKKLYDVTRMFYNNSSLTNFPVSTFRNNLNIYKFKHVLVGSNVNEVGQIIWPIM